MKKRLFSGIQPTGEVHIGNYLGAIKNWISLLEEYECIFSIVDYHAITLPQDSKTLPKQILHMATVLIAAGIVPQRSILFLQSHVPEHTELAWIFHTLTPIGHLERMTQFKDKASQHRENINAGLFSYPVLQAADILLYKAQVVPVGEDQVQHIELCREIARKFNARYGEFFPEPSELLSTAPRIMGLDGKKKMSKSLNNHISVTESPEDIWKKLSVAVTDENRKRRSDPGNPENCNIYNLHKCFSCPDAIDRLAQGCRTAGIGCIECKKYLADNIIEEFKPIRERATSLFEQPGYVREVLQRGAERCQEIARQTIKEVKTTIGLQLPGD